MLGHSPQGIVRRGDSFPGGMQVPQLAGGLRGPSGEFGGGGFSYRDPLRHNYRPTAVRFSQLQIDSIQANLWSYESYAIE